MENSRKIIIFIFVFLVLLGLSGYRAWWKIQVNLKQDTTDSNTNANANTTTDDGYVALEDITMDQSKWVTYRNEELGVELRLPGELYEVVEKYHISSASGDTLIHTIEMFGRDREPNKNREREGDMVISIWDGRDYYKKGFTKEEFKLGVPFFEGEPSPLVSSSLNDWNGIPRYEEVRISTTADQCRSAIAKEWVDSCDPSEGIARIEVKFQYLINNNIYTVFMQVDSNNNDPYITMFQNIGRSFEVITK